MIRETSSRRNVPFFFLVSRSDRNLFKCENSLILNCETFRAGKLLSLRLRARPGRELICGEPFTSSFSSTNRWRNAREITTCRFYERFLRSPEARCENNKAVPRLIAGSCSSNNGEILLLRAGESAPISHACIFTRRRKAWESVK